MDTFWHICEAIGVGGAAGLSPLVAIAVLVLAAALKLGLTSDNSDVDFLAGIAAIIVAAIVLVQSFLLVAAPGGMKLRISADRPRLVTLHVLVAVVIGAIAGGIVFGAEHDTTAIGAVAGALAAALVAYASAGLLSGVTQRLDATEARQKGSKAGDETAKDNAATRRILALGVDLVTIVAVILPLVIPLTGLILPILAIAILAGARRREAKKHEGLRVLS